MKILVIGSNSFSGSNLVKNLLEEGYDVIGVSRSKEYNSAFLPYKNHKKLKNFRFYNYDINNNTQDISKLIKKEKINNIFNFAAQGEVKSSFDFPIDHFRTNLVSQINLLEKIRKFDFIDNYIQISTPEVYGTVKNPVFESFNYNPSSPYAASKGGFDLYLLTLFKTYKFPVKFIRSSNVYGPCQQLYRIIPKSLILLSQNKKIPLHGGGRAQKIFTFTDDVSKGNILVMKKGITGEIYHISSTKMISVKELVKKICILVNKNFQKNIIIIKERIGEDRYYNISSKKIRKELSWKEEFSLDLGLTLTYKWVYDNFNFLKNQKLIYLHKK